MIRKIAVDLSIIPPGVGAQGGSAGDTIRTGGDYVILGRSIYQSDDPAAGTKGRYRVWSSRICLPPGCSASGVHYSADET
ncbi:MAG: Orotidine 5'-phosphate decarboxylase [ANME-2 cluster archaeon]|nr:Orotidine 5'-phosphate decarboxylase [ANME-2 cluster archaeon]